MHTCCNLVVDLEDVVARGLRSHGHDCLAVGRWSRGNGVAYVATGRVRTLKRIWGSCVMGEETGTRNLFMALMVSSIKLFVNNLLRLEKSLELLR